MRRLLPDAGTTSAGEQVGELELVSMAGEGRPYVVSNFALTLDGRSTIDGRSGPIGSKRDTEMLVGLRARVDAILIGAGTMRAERYGRLIADPHKRARRERIGLPHDPLLVIVTAGLELPWDAPVFTKPSGRVLIVTSSQDDVPEVAAPLRVLRRPGGVDLAELLAYLRRERGVRALLCEGGAKLHAELIEADLVDELFVTIAPKLGGGDGPGLVAELEARQRLLELVWLLESDGELFARYRLLRHPKITVQ